MNKFLATLKLDKRSKFATQFKDSKHSQSSSTVLSISLLLVDFKKSLAIFKNSKQYIKSFGKLSVHDYCADSSTKTVSDEETVNKSEPKQHYSAEYLQDLTNSAYRDEVYKRLRQLYEYFGIHTLLDAQIKIFTSEECDVFDIENVIAYYTDTVQKIKTHVKYLETVFYIYLHVNYLYNSLKTNFNEKINIEPFDEFVQPLSIETTIQFDTNNIVDRFAKDTDTETETEYSDEKIDKNTANIET
jgi:hypothetical protein